MKLTKHLRVWFQANNISFTANVMGEKIINSAYFISVYLKLVAEVSQRNIFEGNFLSKI